MLFVFDGKGHNVPPSVFRLLEMMSRRPLGLVGQAMIRHALAENVIWRVIEQEVGCSLQDSIATHSWQVQLSDDKSELAVYIPDEFSYPENGGVNTRAVESLAKAVCALGWVEQGFSSVSGADRYRFARA